jgi:hypothetical protein
LSSSQSPRYCLYTKDLNPRREEEEEEEEEEERRSKRGAAIYTQGAAKHVRTPGLV